MAQVSYGTITVSDLTDITDMYFEYCLVRSEISDLENTYGFKILTSDTSVQTGKTYYKYENDAYVAVTPQSGANPVNEGWYEDTPGEVPWSTEHPEWKNGFQIWVREVKVKEGISELIYGRPFLETAVNQTNENLQSLDIRTKHFWENLNPTSTYPAGIYMATGKDSVDFETEDSSTYGYNSHFGDNGIRFRYDDVDFSYWGINSNGNGELNFYNPNYVFIETTDDSFVSGKTYYEKNTSNEYIVTQDTTKSSSKIYYERVLTSGNAKVQIDNSGLKINNQNGIPIVKYGQDIQFFTELEPNTPIMSIGVDGGIPKVIIGNRIKPHIEIDNDSLDFYNGAQRVSYIEEDKLYIPMAVVLNEMLIGAEHIQVYKETIDLTPQSGKTYYTYDENNDTYVEFEGNSFDSETIYYEYDHDEDNKLWSWQKTEGKNLRLVWVGGSV